MKNVRFLVGAFATTLALSACTDKDDGADSASGLLDAVYKACSTGETVDWKAYGSQAPDVADVIQLSEDGNTITVKTPRTQGEDLGNLSYTVGRCILREANAPKSVGRAMVKANFAGDFDLHKQEWTALAVPTRIKFEWYDHASQRGTAWDATFEASAAD